MSGAAVMWRGGRRTSARRTSYRVALHRPVERHSSRDRAWATKSRWGRGQWEVGRDWRFGRTRIEIRFALSKAAGKRAAHNFGFATKSLPGWKSWGYWGGARGGADDIEKVRQTGRVHSDPSAQLLVRGRSLRGWTLERGLRRTPEWAFVLAASRVRVGCAPPGHKMGSSSLPDRDLRQV